MFLKPQEPPRGPERTRIAMSLIKIMLESESAKNILCVVDKPDLISQAESTAKKFLDVPVKNLKNSPDSFPKGLHFSTAQDIINSNAKLFKDKSNQKALDLIILCNSHTKTCILKGIIKVIKGKYPCSCDKLELIRLLKDFSAKRIILS